jgi:hypothetical protein
MDVMCGRQRLGTNAVHSGKGPRATTHGVAQGSRCNAERQEARLDHGEVVQGTHHAASSADAPSGAERPEQKHYFLRLGASLSLARLIGVKGASQYGAYESHA